MNDIQLIIPMSGIGKRFIDAGYNDPKPLIIVDGKPIIDHVVGLFPNVTDITFICNELHLETTNMSDILKSISPNCKIYSVPNVNRKGPVDAISKIFDLIDDNKETIISYCDYGTYWDFDKFLNFIRSNNLDGAIPCYIGFHPHMLGSDNYAFCRQNNHLLTEIKEKESFTNNKMNEYASNGTYYFKNGKILKKYFKELINKDINLNGEYYVSLVYNLLVKDNLKVGIFEIDNMLQWGTPFDLEIYKGWSDYFKNITINQTPNTNPNGTTLILPMAGRGSRFSDIGFNLPKPMIDINGKPMVIQAVNCLPKSDNNIFICLKSHADKFNIDDELKNTYPNSKILPIDQTTDGQACTCEIGIKYFNIDPEKPIMISACDNGVYYDHNKYESLLNDQDNDIIVWSFRNNQTSKINPNMYAWLKVNDNDEIEHVSCKKFIYDDPLKTHAIIGTMFFRKAKYFLDGLNKNYEENIRTNGEFYVDDVLNQNIKDGLKLKVFEVKNYICWGTPNDYLTYIYWRDFFNKCQWHPYKLENDITNK
jgi:NDP-sugar pyrophosphorylase family protein